MVELITPENAALYEDVIVDMHKMRYRVAVEQWGWNIPDIEPGYDKDDFDTDDTIYFLCLDATEKKVLACARLNPTTKPHMLSEVFADSCVENEVPRSRFIYEFSRYVVDHCAMNKNELHAVRGRLSAAVNKFCLQANITHLTYLAYFSSYARSLKHWQTEPLGLPKYFEEDDATYIAAKSSMTEEGLENLRRYFGLSEYEPYVSTRVNWLQHPAMTRITALVNDATIAA